MFSYDIIRTQWAIAAFLGGLAVLAAMVLVYSALWRPRDGEPISEGGFIRWWISFCPWILTLTFVFGTALGVWYAIYRIWNPPNW